MGRILRSFILSLVSILVTLWIVISLFNNSFSVPERIFLGFLLVALIICWASVWTGSRYKHSEISYKVDDLSEQITGNPVLWVKAGLIPPTRTIAKRLITNRDIEEAIETLNKRSTNRNMAIWSLNNLMAKEFRWFKNKDWGMNLDSLVQIDYGVGRIKMIYYLDTKIKIPVLVVWVSWRNDKPIFYFHGILSTKVSRIWRNFLQTTYSKGNNDRP